MPFMEIFSCCVKRFRNHDGFKGFTQIFRDFSKKKRSKHSNSEIIKALVVSHLMCRTILIVELLRWLITENFRITKQCEVVVCQVKISSKHTKNKVRVTRF